MKTIKRRISTLKTGISLFVLFLSYLSAFAQDGNAGINEATNYMRRYFRTGTTLMYAIGALAFMAGLFLLKCKLDFEEEAPLMSVRDARILMIVSLFGTDQEIQDRIDQMEVRHRKRQYDIDRRYVT